MLAGPPWATCWEMASRDHFSYGFVRWRDLPGPTAGKWPPEATFHIDLYAGGASLGQLLGNGPQRPLFVQICSVAGLPRATGAFSGISQRCVTSVSPSGISHRYLLAVSLICISHRYLSSVSHIGISYRYLNSAYHIGISYRDIISVSHIGISRRYLLSESLTD